MKSGILGILSIIAILALIIGGIVAMNLIHDKLTLGAEKRDRRAQYEKHMRDHEDPMFYHHH